MPRLRDRLKAFAHPSVETSAPAAAVARSEKRPLSQYDLSAKDAKTRAIDGTYAAQPVMGGRQTQPGNYSPFGLNGWYFIPKRQYDLIDVTELDVTSFTANQLLSLLPDMSPEMGKALWTYLRTAGTDCQFTALTAAGKEDPRGQTILDDIIDGLNPQYGGIEAILRQLLTTAYVQGAVCAEAAPTDSLKDLDDVFPVNPDSISFERDDKQVLVPFQRQQIWHASAAMPYRMLNEETFFYIPVDPFPDDPYGRAPAAPILQVVFGLAQVLRDLQKVVHHQGWPRLDIKLLWSLMEPTIPEAVKADEQKKQKWLADRMAEVTTAYNAMQPEDAFVHMDFVELSSSAASSGTKLFDVSAVMQIFRQEMIEALKSLPIFHGGGGDKGQTETYGSIEFEIYVQSVETLREIVAEVMVRALTVALHFRGYDCLVQHQWGAVRTTQRLTDAQAEAQEIENEANKRDQGWVTQDDASEAVTGSMAVAPPPAPFAAPMAAPKPLAQNDKTFPPPPAVGSEMAMGGALAYAAAALKVASNGHKR